MCSNSKISISRLEVLNCQKITFQELRSGNGIKHGMSCHCHCIIIFVIVFVYVFDFVSDNLLVAKRFTFNIPNQNLILTLTERNKNMYCFDIFNHNSR